VQLEGIKAGTRFDWESMRGESYVQSIRLAAHSSAAVETSLSQRSI
jgi:hypothetical protein